MNTTTLQRPLTGLLLSVTFTLATATASAASIYVANNGVDSVSCGTKTDPCRSITKGIANAAVEDTVIVGPGSYGDLDGDGILGETGEEVGGMVNFNDCALVLDKLGVSVVSSAGAWSTFLLLGDAATVEATVCMDAANTAFGAYGKGFTVEAPPAAGTNYSVYATAVANAAVIAGNVTSCSNSYSYGFVSSADQSQLLQNRVADGGCSYGIAAYGSAMVVRGNASTGSFYGFHIAGGTGTEFDGNVASGNGWAGLRWESAATITRSSFVGNKAAGIVASATASGPVTGSNLYGNGVISPYTDCGVHDQGSTTTYEENWWGAATGPGSAPANLVCSGPVPSTFADKPASVKLKGTR